MHYSLYSSDAVKSIVSMFIVLSFAGCFFLICPHEAIATSYIKPSPEICNIIEARPIRPARFSFDNRKLVIGTRESTTTLALMKQPMARLAGVRINTNTRCKISALYYKFFTVYSINDDLTVNTLVITPPENGKYSSPRWTSDGKDILFTNTVANGMELWRADSETGETRRVTKPVLSDVLNSAFERTAHPREYFVFLRQDWDKAPRVRHRRKKTPSRGKTTQKRNGEKNHTSSRGPDVYTSGKTAASGRTWQDLLKSDRDVKLFRYLAQNQMAILNIDTGKLKLIQSSGLNFSPSYSPDGKWLLVKEVLEPFSYSVPVEHFAKRYRVINVKTGKETVIANLPVADSIPPNGVRKGIRSLQWVPHVDATLIWTQALDEGDPKVDVPFRDRCMTLSAPFNSDGTESFRTKDRCYNISFTDMKGLVCASQFDWKTRWIRIQMKQILSKSTESPFPERPADISTEFFLDADGLLSTELFSYSYNDDYNSPGEFYTHPHCDGTALVKIEKEHGQFYAYLRDKGATPRGLRPYLKKFNLTTLASREIFRCSETSYEGFHNFLYSPGGERFLVTTYETPKVPTNYVFRREGSDEKRFITSRVTPSPRLKDIRKKLITYRRKDGTPLSGLLCLPPDYEESEKNLAPEKRRPAIIWAYPRSYSGKDTAGQVRGSDNVYTLPGPLSVQLLLFEGYVVLDKAQMPVIGDPLTMNDTFIEQISDSAKAAIEKLDSMGLIDPNRVAIGGHSYGAFMAANLLAHTNLFAAGIGRSGAYNRTLTPFGFQAENRNLWEARDVYLKLSPFLYADQIKEPFLLIHGKVDNNSGTYPMQSERMFQAIKGLGGTSRLVLLPMESHSYKARESIFHTIAEMANWLNKYLKMTPSDTTTQR